MRNSDGEETYRGNLFVRAIALGKKIVADSKTERIVNHKTAIDLFFTINAFATVYI